MFRRLAPAKRGVFLHRRLVELGSSRVRRLGGDRAGEIRLTRFLRNPHVSVHEMVASGLARTAARVAGLHVLAIQDTTTLQADASGCGSVLHPVIALDAASQALLGLVDAQVLHRRGGQREARKQRGFGAKQSARWLEGARKAAHLLEAGAARVTVIADRESDIYEMFALRPEGVDLLVRAGQDRRLADGGSLFARADGLARRGITSLDLPAAPGRKARTARLELGFARVTLACPVSRRQQAGGPAAVRASPLATPAQQDAGLPEHIELTLVVAREVDAPAGMAPAHWRLLTTHAVDDLADACSIIGFYRQRWTIEQLFRTMKSKGFDVEGLRIAEDEPHDKLAVAVLIAAITVLQLVHEREGAASRPISDAFESDDQDLLQRVSASLEGKTQRQKNPHPPKSLAFATWVMARLGGWTGYYGKPGPITIFNGLKHYQAIKQGSALQNV